MLTRQPKTTSFKWSQVFKGVLYVEITFFMGTFYLYRKLCRDQSFYNFMDLVGYDSYRKLDYQKWNIPLKENKKRN